MDFELLNQTETHIVKIANTQTATIESTLFMNNTGLALHVEADDVNITNSEIIIEIMEVQLTLNQTTL